MNSKQLELLDDKLNMRAFLLCSFILCQSAFAFDSSDASLIKAYELLSSGPRGKENFNVDEENFDKEGLRFRNQKRELTDWKQLDEFEWLDFKTWRQNRKIKDENPNWRQIFREATNREVVGRVIKCIGYCLKYRGVRKNSVEHLSIIREGDEILTEKDSGLWALLIDGTLIRLSASSSISFNEVNLSKTEVQFFLRHNYGYASYRVRQSGKFKDLNLPETDLGFHPLKILKANREYFSIEEFRGFSDEQKLQYAIVKNPGYVSQYKALNDIIFENSNKLAKRNTRIFVYTPNAGFESLNTHLDIYYGVKGKTIFRKQNSYSDFLSLDNRHQSLSLSFRGYKNSKEELIENEKWYEVAPDGRAYYSFKGESRRLQAVANFTKRTPSLWLAREIWIKEYSLSFLNPDISNDKIATDYGYRVWNKDSEDELTKRLKFAKEYVRRTETTILKNMDFVFKQYKTEEFGPRYFERSLVLHYNKLKNYFGAKQLLVREMSDTQYYLWTLRYGQEYLLSRTR